MEIFIEGREAKPGRSVGEVEVEWERSEEKGSRTNQRRAGGRWTSPEIGRGIVKVGDHAIAIEGDRHTRDNPRKRGQSDLFLFLSFSYVLDPS